MEGSDDDLDRDPAPLEDDMEGADEKPEAEADADEEGPADEEPE